MFAAGKDVRSVFEDLSMKIPDPIGKELAAMVSRYDLSRSTFEEMLIRLSNKYGSDELRALGNIIRVGATTGGSKSISRSLVRLNRAIRLRARMLAERAKQVAEPSMTAWLVIGILFIFLILDATWLRGEFASSFAGRLDMALGLGVMVVLILLALRLSKEKTNI